MRKEREQAILEDCRGKGMVNAFYIHELFDEIRKLKSEKEELTDLFLKRECEWKTFFNETGRPVKLVDQKMLKAFLSAPVEYESELRDWCCMTCKKDIRVKWPKNAMRIWVNCEVCERLNA